MKAHHLVFRLFGLFLVMFAIQACDLSSQQTVERESKSEQFSTRPFTRWWWMGNAVSREGITSQLEALQRVGIGGVEITPIYGVKGYEDAFISYLDSSWISHLKHTLDEADRLGLAVDMNLGTGWPFGGPHIAPQYAAKRMEIFSFTLSNDLNTIDLLQQVHSKAEQVNLESVIALKPGTADEVLDLTDRVENNQLSITNDLRQYQQVYVLVSSLTGQKVKRAAPGGEGLVLDHFQKEAVLKYLDRFDQAFEQHGLDPSRIRCFFNDSYEVYRANWATNFLNHFESIHQYDFGKFFYALKDTTNTELSARIVNDYRVTLETLLKQNFTDVVTEWCASHGVKFRNQAHGSPGNLLDLYATVDIPETETFRSSNFRIKGLKQDTFVFNDRPNSLILKFASSAAHTSGKPLVSSESATWLDEHFNVTLKKIKPEIDHLFTAGINHVFYHGTTYSPQDENWPGWLFYASTHVDPVNSWWNDLKALNDYIAHCQTYLQNSKPDHDILLYWPVADSYAREKSTRLLQFSVHSDHWMAKDFHRLALEMLNKGYTYDYISDQQLVDLTASDGLLETKGGKYKALIVPEMKYIPEQALKQLERLNGQGVTIIFQNKLPEHLTGYQKREEDPQDLIRTAFQVTSSEAVFQSLNQQGITRESLVDAGLSFIRKQQGDKKMYFIVNNSPNDVNQWLSLSSDFKSIVLVDPLSQKEGKAQTKGGKQVYLQLKSGQSLFLFAHDNEVDQEGWTYYEPAGEAYSLSSSWEVQFMSGGPTLPEARNIEQPASWTSFLSGDDQYFAGTASYTTFFTKPDLDPDAWLLDLSGVHESVQVILNDQVIDTLVSLPMEVVIPGHFIKGSNKLELRISNLMANRIKWLDQKNIEWRKFYDINLVNIHYKKWDTSVWDLLPSGLLKAPELLPVKEKEFQVAPVN
ncbi:MAG: glycosyl hydrolase [Candidatus Cyclobacteriaceae bacterium M3_2C_046]